MELNSRVNAGVIANVDGRTRVQMNGKPYSYIVSCLRQERQNLWYTTSLYFPQWYITKVIKVLIILIIIIKI